MIDTHCHLTFPDFEGRVQEIMAEALDAGVRGAITVSTTTTACLDNLAIARDRSDVWCTAGVHPLYADRDPFLWEHLETVARHERCVAFGELGLDNHYDHPPRDVQRQVLETQLGVIQSLGLDLPVVLHCRNAFEDLIPVLRSTSIPPERFVFHCFTGGPDDMRAVLDFGAWASFT
ncbi:MAG: TatD family hydrolase, partial [Phycisphaerales bacterium]|nr:TatD family hydrolase [Phycisphaerales bacterium]